MNSDKTIFVTGATGQQGFAATQHLLAKGFPVKALTRAITTTKAKQLASFGATLVEGAADDENLLQRELKGCYGLFCVLPSQGSPNASAGYTPSDEISLGKKIVSAAKQADIKHLVYSSMTGLEDKNTTVGNLESKRQIEDLISTLRLPVTIVRPVAFMENYLFPFLYHQNRFVSFLAPELKEPLIASDDIGIFASIVFNDSKKYIGKDIVLVGDLLDHHEIIEIINQKIGSAVEFQLPTDEILRQDPILPIMSNAYQWLNQWLLKYSDALKTDLIHARTLHTGLLRFEDWVEQHGKESLKKLLITKN